MVNSSIVLLGRHDKCISIDVVVVVCVYFYWCTYILVVVPVDMLLLFCT